MSNSKKLEHQIETLKMLEALLIIGISFREALIIMNSKFKTDVWDAQLLAGVPFYKLLTDEDYDKDALLILKIGLDSEDLEKTIKKMIKLLENKIDKQKELVELIKYPVMLLSIAIISIGFVTYFLLPQFESILQSLEVTSKQTNMLYQLFNYGPYVLTVLLLFFVIAAFVFTRLEFDKRTKLIFSLPIVSDIYTALYNQLFVLTLANLLKTNLHLNEVIDILLNQTENRLLSMEARYIKQGLETGKLISESLSLKYYDEQLIEILKLGEESGMLLYYLESYSKVIIAVNESRGKRMLFWIQPIFYMIFGVLILLLYAAIFIPMFTLMDSI